MGISLRALVATALAVATVAAAPGIAGADPDDPTTWPLAQGNFTVASDPGWIFFKPQGFAGRGCGIAPDGVIGCDIVPARWADGTPVQAGIPGPPGFYSCGGQNCPLPPAGANQLVVSPQEAARYAESPVPAFTRDVDTLPTESRIVNGSAWCRLSQQGYLRCVTGDHGFSVNAVGVTLD